MWVTGLEDYCSGSAGKVDTMSVGWLSCFGDLKESLSLGRMKGLLRNVKITYYRYKRFRASFITIY